MVSKRDLNSLFERMKNGTEKAFDDLIEYTRARRWEVAKRIVRDTKFISFEDIFFESEAKLRMSDACCFSCIQHFYRTFYKVLRQRLIDHLRKEKRRIAKRETNVWSHNNEEDGPMQVVDLHKDRASRLIALELRLHELIMNLPAEQRQVIDLHYFEGKTLRKISAESGKTLHQVRRLKDEAMIQLGGILTSESSGSALN